MILRLTRFEIRLELGANKHRAYGDESDAAANLRRFESDGASSTNAMRTRAGLSSEVSVAGHLARVMLFQSAGLFVCAALPRYSHFPEIRRRPRVIDVYSEQVSKRIPDKSRGLHQDLKK